MFISIRRVVPALPKKLYHKEGFTIPEILVCLGITIILLHSIWQWTILTERSNQRIQQNQQAVLLAQESLAGVHSALPEGWTVQHSREEKGALLTVERITVGYEGQYWSFYYAGLAKGHEGGLGCQYGQGNVEA